MRKQKIKINNLTKFFLKFFPHTTMKYFASKQGIDRKIFDQAHNVFIQAKRIDIFPSQSGTRGFIIIIDKKLALYFYQDGDHFKYDGYEMGKYDKRDVTIFDNYISM